jgi:hypothetical protein
LKQKGNTNFDKARLFNRIHANNPWNWYLCSDIAGWIVAGYTIPDYWSAGIRNIDWDFNG